MKPNKAEPVILDFEVRPYTKKELALMYFPNSLPHTAVNHLMAWVTRNETLWSRLNDLGYQKTSKWFTARQVELIVEFLGEP